MMRPTDCARAPTESRGICDRRKPGLTHFIHVLECAYRCGTDEASDAVNEA